MFLGIVLIINQGLHVTSHPEFVFIIRHLCVQEAHNYISNHPRVSVFWINQCYIKRHCEGKKDETKPQVLDKPSVVSSGYGERLEDHVKRRYLGKIAVIGVDPVSLVNSQLDPECLIELAGLELHKVILCFTQILPNHPHL